MCQFEVGETNKPEVNAVVAAIEHDDPDYQVVLEQQQPYTFLKVTWTRRDGLHTYEGVGFAKASYPDQWQPEVGYNIALRRAVKDLLNHKNSVHGVARGRFYMEPVAA